MKWGRGVLCLSATAAAVTPIGKVMSMLEDMHEKGLKAKQDEEVRMSRFNQWCANSQREKSSQIENETEEKAELEAIIAKSAAEIDSLVEQITKHQADQAASEAKIEKEKSERADAKEEYQTTKADYDSAIDSITRAVATLKQQTFDRKQAESLLQVASHKRTPAASREQIAAFLQQPSGEPNAYEFQSGGVIDMLKDLKQKFKGELQDIMEKETNDKHAFELLFQNEQDLINQNKGSISDKQKAKGEQQQRKADAEGDLVDTTKSLNDDRRYLSDSQNLCKLKNEQYKAANQLRASELAQIKEALQVLGSDAVSGGADRNLPKDHVDAEKATSFMQIKSRITRSPLQAKVAAFLQDRASRSNSNMLAELASKVAEDPFSKVKKMIFNMVNKLKEEAVKEAEEHGWCQAELGSNKIERESKESDEEDLKAELEEKNAKIAQETQDIADLTAAISEMDKQLAEAAAAREDEHAKNLAAIADAKAGSEAIGSAIAKLKEFYASAETSPALIQNGQDPSAAEMDAPATFETEYKGMQNMKGGVVGFLEVIQSDFVRLEAETTADEEQSANEFTKLKNDTEVDRATKNAEMDHKQQKVAQLQGDVQTAQADLTTTQEALKAGNDYFASLKKKCIDNGVSHEERMAKRAEEIQSLKEALEILTQ